MQANIDTKDQFSLVKLIAGQLERKPSFTRINLSLCALADAGQKELFMSKDWD
jgi:hypothetical protein